MVKAQIQMMETIAVLFIFFVLVLLGFFFYGNLAGDNIKNKVENFNEMTAIQVAQVASSLPELQCSEQNIVRENCMDWLKAQSARTVLSRDAYFSTLGYSTLTLEKVWPDTGSTVVYNRTLPEYTTLRKHFFPIAVFDATDQNTHFGVLTIEVYS